MVDRLIITGTAPPIGKKQNTQIDPNAVNEGAGRLWVVNHSGCSHLCFKHSFQKHPLHKAKHCIFPNRSVGRGSPYWIRDAGCAAECCEEIYKARVIGSCFCNRLTSTLTMTQRKRSVVLTSISIDTNGLLLCLFAYPFAQLSAYNPLMTSPCEAGLGFNTDYAYDTRRPALRRGASADCTMCPAYSELCGEIRSVILPL